MWQSYFFLCRRLKNNVTCFFMSNTFISISLLMNCITPTIYRHAPTIFTHYKYIEVELLHLLIIAYVTNFYKRLSSMLFFMIL